VIKEYARYGFVDRETAVRWVKEEAPQHRVTVQTFAMGIFEVTQAQWRAVAGFTKVERELSPNPSRFKDDNLPVENVSWEEVMEFCKRLSQRTGKTYRLPSEAEWEYAARAETTTPFAFGETITPEIVNYNGDYPYASAPKGVYRGKALEVGSLRVANAFGLYDMHGNVWEWCEDQWHDSYNGAPIDGSARTDISAPGSYRVIRGGGWSYDAVYCRSASRHWDSPGIRFVNLGFRLVRIGR
jgi:formylglycine-generating enzyme required for sulfatase activity